jgi:hypothetical protein
MPAKVRDRKPCHGCGELAEVKQRRPKRYEDGHVRCDGCWRERVAAIVAYWRAAATAYPVEVNRGGRFPWGGRP